MDSVHGPGDKNSHQTCTHPRKGTSEKGLWELSAAKGREMPAISSLLLQWSTSVAVAARVLVGLMSAPFTVVAAPTAAKQRLSYVFIPD